MIKSSTASTSTKNRHKGRNVVVCCDGTGIGEDHNAGEIVTPSNIVRIFNCIDTASTSGDDNNNGNEQRDQIAYYERGVGSVGNVLTKAGQGLTGYGIGTKIRIMYHWLGVNWRDYEAQEEEDRLFVFGFSRGAFAVRSLIGMIYRVGLLDLSELDASEAHRRVDIAYKQGYQQSKPQSDWAKSKKGDGERWAFHGDKEHGRIPIHFVGAFDTVGQLGMPKETLCLLTFGIFCCFTSKRLAFHEVAPNPCVRTARHAVAMDEMRSTFQPVFSRYLADMELQKGRDIKQVWFPGGHANVGGGVLDTGLSDGSLKWMVDEAAKVGLRFQPDMIAQIQPNFQGNIFLKHGTSLYKVLTFYPRSVPAVIMENCEETIPTDVESVHISAIQRSKSPRISQAPYFNTTYLQVGEQHETILGADQVYNSTFVYMEPGATYTMTAEGMWSGFREHPCGPEGYSTMAFVCRPLHVLRIGMGKLERGCRSCTGNAEARLPWTRRHDRYPWFQVMGMIASGGTRNVVSKADFHTILGIGAQMEYTVEAGRGGYLYCYANDTWNHYTKNKGTMTLTISRTK